MERLLPLPETLLTEDAGVTVFARRGVDTLGRYQFEQEALLPLSEQQLSSEVCDTSPTKSRRAETECLVVPVSGKWVCTCLLVPLQGDSLVTTTQSLDQ